MSHNDNTPSVRPLAEESDISSRVWVGGEGSLLDQLEGREREMTLEIVKIVTRQTRLGLVYIWPYVAVHRTFRTLRVIIPLPFPVPLFEETKTKDFLATNSVVEHFGTRSLLNDYYSVTVAVRQVGEMAHLSVVKVAGHARCNNILKRELGEEEKKNSTVSEYEGNEKTKRKNEDAERIPNEILNFFFLSLRAKRITFNLFLLLSRTFDEVDGWHDTARSDERLANH